MERFFKKMYTILLCITPPNLSTSLDSFQRLDHNRKRLLLKTCLYITFFTLFIFSCLHAFVYQGINNIAFLLEITLSLTALYGIISLTRDPTPEKTAKIATFSTIIFAAFLLVFIHLVPHQNFSLIWVFFFPIFAIIMHGSKLGLRYALVFLTILLFMAYNGIGYWHNGDWNALSFIRLSLAMTILTFIIYINEVALTNAKLQAEFSLKKLHSLSSIDELTQISNRRNIDQALFKAIQHAKRYNTPLTLTLFDIDDFKKINDQWGHLTGDKALFELVQKIKNTIRSTDSFGRWGGEEFLIILPNETLESALQFCEKIRICVENTAFTEYSTQVTCSFGIAEFKKGMTEDQLIEQADKALYQAKNAGKNQVKTFTP